MSKKYYHFEDDLKNYPEAWCYIVWSKRGPGKTYSSLWWALSNKIPIIYMKRTNDDVDLICQQSNYGFDASPYVPINRDKHTNVKAVKINNGLGGFWIHEKGDDEKEHPEGLPVSYCLSCNAIKRFKGFDFSVCQWIVFDEFIPQLGERISRKEGELLLDLYMTVSRDRQKRGLPPLKLILFANAEDISTPITNTLEVVDIMADLNASGKTHYYDQERGILLHHITNDEIPIEDSEKQGIYSAMKNTKWGAKSFDGTFANNDFSNVVKKSIRGMSPFIHLYVNIFGSLVIAIILLIFGDKIAELMKATVSGGTPEHVMSRAVANAHTIFKIFQVIVMFPFAKIIVKLTQLTVRGEDKKSEGFQLMYISQEQMTTPSASLIEVVNEIKRMGKKAADNLQTAFDGMIEKTKEIPYCLPEKKEKTVI